jgi:hypothetical protein
MEPTNDFEAWLDGVELEDNEEVYSLYRSVRDCDEFGLFSVKPARGTDSWPLKASHIDQPLLLLSTKAKNAFLGLIEKSYCGELDMESWYSYKHAMAKGD